MPNRVDSQRGALDVERGKPSQVETCWVPLHLLLLLTIKILQEWWLRCPLHLPNSFHFGRFSSWVHTGRGSPRLTKSRTDHHSQCTNGENWAKDLKLGPSWPLWEVCSPNMIGGLRACRQTYFKWLQKRRLKEDCVEPLISVPQFISCVSLDCLRSLNLSFFIFKLWGTNSSFMEPYLVQCLTPELELITFNFPFPQIQWVVMPNIEISQVSA